jgi:citrate synthase
VASASSNPYAVVIAGLSALEGAKHGGGTSRIAALLGELRRSRDVRRALADRLRRGDTIDGFGHRLYPDGDPRATLLLSMLPHSKELVFLRAAASAAIDLLGEAPNLDFALAAVERALAFPSGSALTLFAIGRTIGWIAHAIEQYETNAIIRPRARYVGPR